ncbi:hypothetical protein KFK09_015067 [Dendrobium nobile]|uniref:Uncharacterized protein n=1 Tax=Dendrobium nobile TaxID=94219 RepID=A0A8T3B5N2_DENNO|nr:hypothetical protein KFK09_015067 [Dendrobium nobile]
MNGRGEKVQSFVNIILSPRSLEDPPASCAPVPDEPLKPEPADRYRPLLLNLLPRGQTVPPSGPSRRTNKSNS